MSQSHTNLFGKNIVTQHSKFMAYFFYIKEEKALNVILRNGKQYRYTSVPVKLFSEIINSPNRASYISIHVIHNSKFKSELVGIVPAADVEKVMQPKSFAAFLAR